MHPQQAPQGWFAKNWWWSIPSCCLGCLVLAVGGCLVLVGGAWTALRTSEPYEEAVERARQHPLVIERLGEPIEVGWMIQGNFNLDGDGRQVNITLPLSGPRGDAQLRIKGERSSGMWTYERLEVEFGDSDSIDLLADPAPPTEAGPDV